jgi:small GTP-binding protein
MKVTRSLVVMVAGFAAIGLLGLLVVVLAGREGRPGSFDRALSLLAAFAAVLIAVLVTPIVMKAVTGASRHGSRKEEAVSARVPEEVARAAEEQAGRAKGFVERIGDAGRRDELSRELAEIAREGRHEVSSLHVVVFGTGSAGKTSLINALLGRHVGRTEAVMGTTGHGESHTYELKGVDSIVLLTDTPGLSEAGPEGKARELEARGLAVRADLLLFVVDHDLVRSEYAAIVELARLGKRSIVVLNKKDRFPDEDLAAILAKLKERLAGVIDPADVVAVAAAPAPVPTRIRRPDGSVETVLDVEEPDILALRTRIGEVLRREGKLLHAANLLVRGRIVEREAQDQLTSERDRKAQEIVDHYQWVTAWTVFANPIPALDILAGGAVQLDMISELARMHGIELSVGQVRTLAGQMVQSVLKLGLVEATASLIAGVFKRTLVGFAAGGAVQAVTMAYLTRVSGRAFIEYFRHGQGWGPDGIDGTVLSQFELNSRSEFLLDFASGVVNRVLKGVTPRDTQASEKDAR